LKSNVVCAAVAEEEDDAFLSVLSIAFRVGLALLRLLLALTAWLLENEKVQSDIE
jgi:hypothetical protein